MTNSLFEAMGGEPGIRRLAEAWHRRCLADPIVAHAFSHGFHPDHTARLAAYWAEALGGPARYSGGLGTETEVVRMHSGNGEASEMYAAGAACFAAALTDVGITDGPLRERMRAWWADSIERMDAYPESRDDVPLGLTIPRWRG
ncbi:MAG: oxidoreductase [Propionibacteriaceae bacterium]|nr:oxidoreductase [Propionibacteriaceae bacterium]